MEKVEGPRVDRQLFEGIEVEIGLPEELHGYFAEDRDRAGHELPVPAMRRAGACHVERDRPHPFVRVGLRQTAVFEHGHGPPADVVVDAIDRPLHAGVAIVVGSAFGQQRADRRHHQKRPLDRPWRLVLEHVGMKATVGRQQAVERRIDGPPRLGGIAEGRRGRLQVGEPSPQFGRDEVGSIGPFDHRAVVVGWLDRRVEVVHAAPDGRVEGPRREVEVAEHHRRGVAGS